MADSPASFFVLHAPGALIVRYDLLADALQHAAFLAAEGVEGALITDCAGRSIPVPELEVSP